MKAIDGDIMEFEKEFREVLELINSSKSILIVTHIYPDVDTISSALALSSYLKRIKKSHKVFNAGGFDNKYSFLPLFDKTVKKLPKFYDLIISVDCAREDRFGFEAKKDINIINIDHHISNDNFGKINIVKESAPATAELIFDFFETLNIEIDKDIATCIYAGIYDDSLGFSIDRVSSRTFEVVSKLCKSGISVYEIASNLKYNESLAKYRLYPKVFDSLELFLEGKVAVIVCKKEWIEESGAKYEDAKSVVEEVLRIKVVEVAILLSELPNKTKVSIRSKNSVDVSLVAKEFSGGGHKKAAGFVCNDSIEELKIKLIDIIKNIEI